MTHHLRHLLMLASVALLPAVARAQGPPLPKPGPEHAVLKEDVGTWEATVEVMTPGAPSTPPSKGVEVNSMACGGLCLATDFKGQVMGAVFEGHGITTWDPARKLYVGSWSDSMTAGLATTESTWDAAKKTLNTTILTPDGSGGTVKLRSTVEYGAGRRVFSLFMPGPDGKEVPSMRITYTKRK